MSLASHQQALLLFRVGPVFCCAPTAAVQTIIVPPTVTHPPGASPASPGIFKHAGKIIRARDLRVLFGVDTVTATATARVIITQQTNSDIGFWVDEIIGIIAMPTTHFGSLPALIPHGIFSRTFIQEQRIYLYSEFAQLATLTQHGYLRSYIEQLTAAHICKTELALPQTSASHISQPTEQAVNTFHTNQLIPSVSRSQPIPQQKPTSIPTSKHTPQPTRTPSSYTALTTKSAQSVTQNAITATTPPLSRAQPLINKPVIGLVTPIPINKPVPKPGATPVTTTYIEYIVPVMVLIVILGGVWGLLSWNSIPEPLIAQTVSTTNHLNLPSIPDTVTPTTPAPTVPAASYHAEIHPNSNGITIVLKAPSPEPSLATATSSHSPSPVTQKEIVHIVEKGDTLWDIAARYVNDPYRYPELAALSRIKNPDLIYPGDRVTIIHQ